MSAASRRPRVVVVRGHQANSWHLRPWRHLQDEFDVVVVRTPSNWFDTELLGVPTVEARTVRDLLPRGRVGDFLARVPGDRYLRPAEALAGADVVHSQDLGFWYSMQAARLKQRLGFKLVLTVWETIPFLGAWRNVRTRPYRRVVLRETDRFLAATEHAALCLELEGAPRERIELCAPGVDTELFGSAAAEHPAEHVILTAGRLVWEKGHQDVLRAVAALRRGAIPGPGVPVRVLIVGSGPEEGRLRRYADELGIADRVELLSELPYERMPAVHAGASCLVLASLPRWFWEEQYGMVLAEAIASGLPVIASTSGAIPEVGGDAFTYFSPGDWVALARALAAGPLSRPPGERAAYPPELVEHHSDRAAAERLRASYRSLLGVRA
jgi:glycosyltransferase involved in cell wall biosynthesis